LCGQRKPQAGLNLPWQVPTPWACLPVRPVQVRAAWAQAQQFLVQVAWALAWQPEQEQEQEVQPVVAAATLCRLAQGRRSTGPQGRVHGSYRVLPLLAGARRAWVAFAAIRLGVVVESVVAVRRAQ